MKKILLLAAFIGALTFVGCNKDDNYQEWGTYPETMLYATLDIVENLENADEEEYIFTTDNGIKVFMVDSKVGNLTLSDAEDGERMIISFTVIEDYTEKGDSSLEGAAYDCDYGLRLFGLRRVVEAQKEVVTTKEDDEAIADMPFSYIMSSISYRHGYINMTGRIAADSFEDINIYLVDNQYSEPDETKKGYYNLELRLDRGTDAERPKQNFDEYISLNLSQFETELKDMDGILLRIVTDASDEISVKIDIDSDDDDDDSDSDKRSLPSIKALL